MGVGYEEQHLWLVMPDDGLKESIKVGMGPARTPKRTHAGQRLPLLTTLCGENTFLETQTRPGAVTPAETTAATYCLKPQMEAL